MPLPKPQAALLFNNYFDEDSLSELEQSLDIELILAGAYYNFVEGDARPLMLDKKVPLPDSVSGSGYKTPFQIPNNGGHTSFQIYSESDFVEITTDSINVAELFNEFEFTSKKTEGNEKTTTIYISSNLYAALDGFFSVDGEKLAVPFIVGEVVSASKQKTDEKMPVEEIGNLPAGTGQSDSPIENLQEINIGQMSIDLVDAGDEP